MNKKISKRKPKKLNPKQKLAFDFLIDHANSGVSFSHEDFIAATGWAKSAVTTYIGKKYRDFLTKTGSKYIVNRHFLTMTETKFWELVTQNTDVLTEYTLQRYDEIITFEFLLPLTHEGLLRATLDALFYLDAVQNRLRDIGLDEVKKYIKPKIEQTDDDYVSDVCKFVSSHFGGYSISHVQGRFRAGDLSTTTQVGEFLRTSQRYLVDETTAVVRFIVPIHQSMTSIDSDYADVFENSAENLLTMVSDEIHVEIMQIRYLFFKLFVEFVVQIIKGEDAIWLLESGPARRLYEWSKTGG